MMHARITNSITGAFQIDLGGRAFSIEPRLGLGNFLEGRYGPALGIYERCRAKNLTMQEVADIMFQLLLDQPGAPETHDDMAELIHKSRASIDCMAHIAGFCSALLFGGPEFAKDEAALSKKPPGKPKGSHPSRSPTQK